jgi:hypothetical protein
MRLSKMVEELQESSLKNQEVPEIHLKDFKGDLEREVLNITKEKEKRDRIGYIMSSVVANTSCNFDHIGADDRHKFAKQYAASTFNYKRIFAQA